MANRYWVGGTATWDGTAGTKWALTSGGAGGQAVPTSADTVFFDANSGANTVTIGSGTAVCSTLTMTGFTGTLAFGSNSITLAGTNLIYTGATTFSVTGTPLMLCTNSSSSARTITPSATTEANAISFNISAGTGNINPNGSFKNIDFTGFSGTLLNFGKTIYGSLTLSSGMTATDGTNTTTFASTLVQQNITSNGVTFGGPITISGTQTVQLQDALTLTSSRTLTLTSGTLNLNNKTLTAGLFSSSNSNTRAIAFGTGNITLTGSSATVFSMTTATGYTYTGTPTINLTYSGSTGTRAFAFGSTAGATETNVPDIYVTAGSDIIATSGNSYLGSLNFTGFTGTFTRVAFNLYLYRNLVLSSGMTYTAVANGIFFSSTIATTQSITTNGVTVNSGFVPNGTQTVQLQDNLTIGSTYTFTLTSGTFDVNNKNVSTGLFNSSNTNTRSLLMGFGTFTLTGTGTVWNLATSTNLTLTPSTSTIVFNGSGVGTFAGGSKTYYNLTQSSSNALTISGSNTFNTISNTVQPTTITFTASTTQTMTNFNVNGTAGNLVTINSTTSGTQATLNSPSNILNSVKYVSLKDNNATGGIWQAPSNYGNVIVSNVTGWFTGIGSLLIITSVSSTTLNIIKSLLKTISATSTSGVSIVNNINKFISSIATSSALTFKQINKYVTTIVNSLITIIKQSSITKSILSTSSVFIITINKLIKTLTAISTSNASNIKNINKFITTIVNSTALIIKLIIKYLSTILNSNSLILKKVNIVKSISSSSSAFLAATRFYTKVLTITSTSNTIISRAILKVIAIISNTVTTLKKALFKKIIIVTNSVTTLLPSLISFTKYYNERVYYMASKVTTIAVTKFRTIFISKDNNV